MYNWIWIVLGGLILIKYAITTLGLIALFIIAFYVFGTEPTYLELTKGLNLFNKYGTKLNQTGKAEPYSTVTINGKSVPVDKEGNFYEVMDLKNGSNVINVTVKAPFKSSTQTYAVANRKEDKDGICWDWNWNGTFQTLKEY